MRKNIQIAMTLGVVLLFAACQPTIKVLLELVPPCDQGDAMDEVGTLRFEITGKDYQSMASNFSRDKKSGAITGLALGEDVMVRVKGFKGDVEADESVLNTAPLIAGASQPLDYTDQSEREVRIAVPVGKVDTFASATNADNDDCTSMAVARHGHSATYLPKDGRVLIVGGALVDESGDDRIHASAELFNPATGAFEELPEPPGGPRIYHAAVALPDGRALITGGVSFINNNLSTVATGFVFDPSNLKSPYTLVTMPTGQARAHHTATLADTGTSVLIVGGCSNASGGICTRAAADNAFSSALVFDIAQFDQGVTQLSPVPEGLPGGLGRVFHIAVPVGDGRILIAGGHDGTGAPVCRLAIYDSRQTSFLTDFTDELPSEACTSHLAGAALEDGSVLLAGGYKSLDASGNPPTSSAEWSDRTTIWNQNASVRISNGPQLGGATGAPRAEHALFALPGGGVLVVGGVTTSSAIAEIVDLDAESSAATGAPTSQRVSMGAVMLGSGQPLLLGGLDPSSGTFGTTEATTELFFHTTN